MNIHDPHPQGLSGVPNRRASYHLQTAAALAELDADDDHEYNGCNEFLNDDCSMSGVSQASHSTSTSRRVAAGVTAVARRMVRRSSNGRVPPDVVSVVQGTEHNSVGGGGRYPQPPPPLRGRSFSTNSVRSKKGARSFATALPRQGLSKASSVILGRGKKTSGNSSSNANNKRTPAPVPTGTASATRATQKTFAPEDEARDDDTQVSSSSSSSSSAREVEVNRDDGTYAGHRNDRGERHGFGMCVYDGKDGRQGEVYQGEWKDGLRHGRGVATWTLEASDGSMLCARYEGDFQDDQQHGRGVETQSDGSRYVGDFCRGVREGWGSWISNSAATSSALQYDGEWKDGLFHGQGILQSLDGRNCYDGDFAQGKRHGRGRFTLCQQQGKEEVYVGEYLWDKKNGKGSYTWPDGSRYVGDWRDGRAHGHGVLYSGRGGRRGEERYEGEFENDQMHGSGWRYFKNGRRYKEVWRRGRLAVV